MGNDLAPTTGREQGDAAGPASAGRDYGETLWQPTASSASKAVVTEYARWLAGHGGPDIPAPDGVLAYRDLWRWSVDEPAAFWSSIWDFFAVVGSRGPGPIISGQLPDVSWFAWHNPQLCAERPLPSGVDSARTAVRYSSEAGRSGQLSYGELRAQVGRVGQA